MPDTAIWTIDATYQEALILVMRLCLAVIAGGVVAQFAKRRRGLDSDPTLSVTLVLMCVLIAMATQIIGSNIARAFSLVGALSIVRFRTAVAATQDVAFVLATVVIGMAIGAGQFVIAGVGLILICLISVAVIDRSSRSGEPKLPTASRRLLLQATLGPEQTWLPSLEKISAVSQLIGVETVRRGSAFLYEYRVTLRDNVDVGQAAHTLSSVPQIESVSFKAF